MNSRIVIRDLRLRIAELESQLEVYRNMSNNPRWPMGTLEKVDFLGQFGSYDLWYCFQDKTGGPRVIARYGIEYYEYLTEAHAESLGSIPPIAEAQARAKEKGLPL